MWVETYSVFRNEKLTMQEPTTRELGQLLDLRPEWVDDITTEVRNWNCREPPPIQLLSEIGIAGVYWLLAFGSVQKYRPVYFSKTRPPWLSAAGSMEYPTMSIERLAFF